MQRNAQPEKSIIVGESFDGASNMRGQFISVQKRIKDVSPNSIYTWCYAHVLNLAATDMVENIIAVKNLMGLLQSTATFFSDSCKRMNVWSEVLGAQAVGSAKLKRLQKVGATRWWLKKAALETILGIYDDSEKGTFLVLLQAPNVNSNVNSKAPNVNSKATYDASALLAKLCQFDIFLTAFLLLFLQYLMRSIRLFANKRIRLAFRLDYRYSLNASAFSNLFLVYEYLLTLSFTQVSCERAFSKLKFIKTRLRCNLANEKLEVFMLMCSEKDLLDGITVDDIISILTKDSSVFAKLLSL